MSELHCLSSGAQASTLSQEGGRQADQQLAGLGIFVLWAASAWVLAGTCVRARAAVPAGTHLAYGPHDAVARVGDALVRR